MIDFSELARKAVLDIPRYKTGVSPQLLKALQSGAELSRLASNENPYGASPRVYEAIRAVDNVHLYPDGGNTAVREALASQLSVEADRILVSTGSENVLSAVFSSVLVPGDRVVTLTPTFMLAEILTKALGADQVKVAYNDHLEYSADAVCDASADAKILYLSNPNNPTGNAFTADELSRIVSATKPSTLVIIDEAYFEYAAHHDGFDSSLPLLDASERPYIVLRTFSKAYGLAGLRVGYGICYHPDMVPLVRRGSTIFDVGSISQAAAVAALSDRAHMETAVSKTIAEKERVLSELDKTNVRIFPSFGNFVSLWFAERNQAMELEAHLANHAVFVKALPARGDEGLVRVSVGRPEDNDRFLDALASRS